MIEARATLEAIEQRPDFDAGKPSIEWEAAIRDVESKTRMHQSKTFSATDEAAKETETPLEKWEKDAIRVDASFDERADAAENSKNKAMLISLSADPDEKIRAMVAANAAWTPEQAAKTENQVEGAKPPQPTPEAQKQPPAEKAPEPKSSPAAKTEKPDLSDQHKPVSGATKTLDLKTNNLAVGLVEAASHIGESAAAGFKAGWENQAAKGSLDTAASRIQAFQQARAAMIAEPTIATQSACEAAAAAVYGDQVARKAMGKEDRMAAMVYAEDHAKKLEAAKAAKQQPERMEKGEKNPQTAATSSATKKPAEAAKPAAKPAEPKPDPAKLLGEAVAAYHAAKTGPERAEAGRKIAGIAQAHPEAAAGLKPADGALTAQATKAYGAKPEADEGAIRARAGIPKAADPYAEFDAAKVRNRGASGLEAIERARAERGCAAIDCMGDAPRYAAVAKADPPKASEIKAVRDAYVSQEAQKILRAATAATQRTVATA